MGCGCGDHVRAKIALVFGQGYDKDQPLYIVSHEGRERCDRSRLCAEPLDCPAPIRQAKVLPWVNASTLIGMAEGRALRFAVMPARASSAHSLCSICPPPDTS